MDTTIIYIHYIFIIITIVLCEVNEIPKTVKLKLRKSKIFQCMTLRQKNEIRLINNDEFNIFKYVSNELKLFI